MSKKRDISDLDGKSLFGYKDGSVINWKGENYVPQRLSIRAFLNNYIRVPLVELWRSHE